MFSLDDYGYDLPESLIAQSPATQRDFARLLCVERGSGRIAHRRFSELADILKPNDILVTNNTEVIPGRLLGKKTTGDVLLCRAHLMPEDFILIVAEEDTLVDGHRLEGVGVSPHIEIDFKLTADGKSDSQLDTALDVLSDITHGRKDFDSFLYQNR